MISKPDGKESVPYLSSMSLKSCLFRPSSLMASALSVWLISCIYSLTGFKMWFQPCSGPPVLLTLMLFYIMWYHGLERFSCPYQVGIFFPTGRPSWWFLNFISKQIADASSQWQVKWCVFTWLWDSGESWTHLTISLYALRYASICKLLVNFKCNRCSFIFMQHLGMPTEKGS